MAKRGVPPCMRGLKRFEKSGCPMKCWDGEEGCTAWVELMIQPHESPLGEKDKVGQCIDSWNLTMQLRQLGLLEGTQRAIESFRNNMTVDGSPKPDPALYVLVKAIEKQQRLLIPDAQLLE